MIEVEIKSFLDNLEYQLKEIFLKYELLGKEEIVDLLETIHSLIENIEKHKEIYLPIEAHPIDKYGMRELVINLANHGTAHSQIASVISIQTGIVISTREVSNWLDNYSNLSIVQKNSQTANVFDIQNGMQSIYAQLLDHLEIVKETDQEDYFKAKTTKQQVVLETYKEIRALTKDAASILQVISKQEQLESFKNAVLDSIKEVSPSTAQIIVKKLKDNKALYNSLMPPS